MDTEIEALEAKVNKVIAVVTQLRAENESLRSQLAAAETEKLRLQQTMTAARQRLEGLIDKLPEDL
ncbi:hypothetical protein VX159_00875 [Dechloromonas sp. ZY10]|uniref:hypothetical protein n=1 Tax=Dechloromonas aquae TaxID=2664436 RepID=UPI003529576F